MCNLLSLAACFSGSKSPGSALNEHEERSQNHVKQAKAHQTTDHESSASYSALQAIEDDSTKIPSSTWELPREDTTEPAAKTTPQKKAVAFQQEPTTPRRIHGESLERGDASTTSVILKARDDCSQGNSVVSLVTTAHAPRKVTIDGVFDDTDDSNASRASSKHCSLNDVSRTSMSLRGKVEEVQSICDYIIAANAFVHALQSERASR